MSETRPVGRFEAVARLAAGTVATAMVTARSASLRAAIVALVAAAAVVVACSDGAGDTAELSLKCPPRGAQEPVHDLSGLSLDEAYARMAESMACPGYALKVVTTENAEIVYPEEGTFSYAIEGTMWIDVPVDRARQETSTEYASLDEDGNPLGEQHEDRAEIVLGDAKYRGPTEDNPPGGSQALICHESNSALLSMLLNCAGATEDSVTRVEPDALHEGRRMAALVTEGSTQGSDETTVFTQHLYLDADTLLPVMSISEGTLNRKRPIRSEVTYEYDFVPLDSLPVDFFDPAAIGYVEPDPEEGLRGVDAGIVLHWLGREFPGAPGLPALSLDTAHAAILPPEVPAPRDRATIDYRLTDEKFGPPVVTLTLYARGEWDSFLAQSPGRNMWNSSCIQRIEIGLPDRRAIIFGGYEANSAGCVPPTSEEWGAYVYIGDTVVLVSATFAYEPGLESARSLYSSHEGMEAIIRGLVARPSDE